MAAPSGKPATMVAGALGIWMGIHAFRTFTAMVVWNAAADMSVNQMGLIAGLIFFTGLLAWIPTRFIGGTRPAWRFGVALAALTILRQAFPGEYLSPTLSFATLILWLWWLPAFLAEATINLAPAIMLGLVIQAAGQAAMHGLDLPVLRGSETVLAAAAMALIFTAALWQAEPDEPSGGAPWGALALGPYLYLQMTILNNVGHVSMHSGLSQPLSSLLILIGLLGGMVAIRWTPTWLQRMGIGLVITTILVWADTVWPLIPAQVGLALLLSAAFAPGGRPAKPLVYSTTAFGMAAMIVMIFLFYGNFGWYILWPFATLGLTFAALLSQEPSEEQAFWPIVIGSGVALVGLVASLLPYSADRPLAREAQGDLTVLQYNIHQGYDVWSVPSGPAIASTIEAMDADLIGLQEVNRGWDVSGGVDMVAWLRWRFPQYYLVYGPMNGSLWGNVIMSRYPVRDVGAMHFSMGASNLPMGLVWATIPSQEGDLFFICTHFSPYAGFDDDRSTEAQELLRFWQGRRLTIIVGDLNAHPGDSAIQRLLTGGLVDVPAAAGLGQAFTYTSLNPLERIDYILSSPDLHTVAASLPKSYASDHNPVLALIRMGTGSDNEQKEQPQ